MSMFKVSTKHFNVNIKVTVIKNVDRKPAVRCINVATKSPNRSVDEATVKLTRPKMCIDVVHIAITLETIE